MKRICFLRHGEAEDLGGDWKDDSLRPLTPEGRRRIAEEARGMIFLGLSFDRVVTSPYVRARQTADEVALAHRIFDRVVESELLEPGASMSDLKKAMTGVEGDSILVVGHAPDLARCVGQLIAGDEVPLGMGTLAWVELKKPVLASRGGTLHALLPADILAAVGRLQS